MKYFINIIILLNFTFPNQTWHVIKGQIIYIYINK